MSSCISIKRKISHIFIVFMVSPGLNDGEIKGLFEGKVSAFEHVYNLYFRQLYYFASKIVQDAEAAKDLTVDTFVKVLKTPRQFNSQEHLKRFLFTILRNACLDYRKSQDRHKKSHEEIRYLSEIKEDIELAFIKSEAIKAIYQEIEQLPPQCRQIIKLIFIEGQTVHEIAGRLNIAEQTVQNQKNRGVKLLKSALVRNRLLSLAIIRMCYELIEKNAILTNC